MTTDIEEPMGVLITRPLPQSRRIAKGMEPLSVNPFIFPVLEITESDDIDSFHQSLRNLSHVSLLIFVSVAAVKAFALGLKQLGLSVPRDLEVAVLGARSAQECRAYGIEVAYLPSQTSDSEGLIRSLANGQWTGKQVVIYRGQKGRELLGEQLLNWGANVHYVEVYRRSLTSASPEKMIDSWRAGEIRLVLVTSQSIIDGLFDLLGQANVALMETTPIVTISERIARYCRSRGMRAKIWVTESPGDGDILACIDSAVAEMCAK